jgi:glycogen debranching enzyme
MHEQRRGYAVRGDRGWGAVYFGSVDATPLFVIALHEAWRWGAEPSEIERLLDRAERAIEWLSTYGDPDHDGFIEYDNEPGPNRLMNQGWKDSHDGIRSGDGRPPKGPIAVVEAQGYAYAALIAMAELRAAFACGDPDELRERAVELQNQIEREFWMEDEQTFAVALDGEKRQVDSVTSNPGLLLWCGAVTPEKAQRVATRMLHEDCWSGYGIRTLSSSNPAYHPMSYHRGSIWSHDTAMAAAGLYRYGHLDEGTTVAEGLFRAAHHFRGRLPELFGGFSSTDFPEPIPYPSACVPHAWAAAAPILLLRAMLGLDPDVPHGRLRLRPRLPQGLRVVIDGLQLGKRRVSIRAESWDAQVEGHEALELIIE